MSHTSEILAGRTVIITGAAQGIGATFASGLAKQGARLCLSDIIPPDAVVAQIRDSGGEAIGTVCDVTDRAAVERMVSTTAEAFGGVDGLVNNAAMFTNLKKKPFEDIDVEEFERVMSVNVRGPFECARAVVPIMRRKGYGKIVNIGSGTAFKGTPMLLSYVTSKGAVMAMTRCMARELGRDGISVNTLAPGLTMSEGVAGQDAWVSDGEATVASRCFKRQQAPSDLVGALVYLLSEASDFMTGQSMVVDGGSVML